MPVVASRRGAAGSAAASSAITSSPTRCSARSTWACQKLTSAAFARCRGRHDGQSRRRRRLPKGMATVMGERCKPFHWESIVATCGLHSVSQERRGDMRSPSSRSTGYLLQCSRDEAAGASH
jgi:hypothetical protein